MTNISTVYDAILSSLVTLFPTKTRIPYAYSLTDNNDNFLRNGYGVKIGSAEFTPFETCNFQVDRSVSVVFTKEVYRNESDYSVIDDITKELLENVVSTQSLFYAYTELGVEANIMKVDLSSVSAVEEIEGGKSKFLSMEVNFIFSIREAL